MNLRILIVVLLSGTAFARGQHSQDPISDASARAHLQELCMKCHGPKKIKGKVRLDHPFDEVHQDTWSKIVEVLKHHDMPPEAENQPVEELRRQLQSWAQRHLNRRILKRAGDPGAVAWRRLTAIELDNMVRDLTGHAMEASRHFPAENFGGEGFSNLGSVQSALSGPVLDKYMAMAEEVANHARFDQKGALVFDPPDVIKAREVRRDKALADIKLIGRQVCGELYLGKGKLVGGEDDERALDNAFRKGAETWAGPGRYLECVWLAGAAGDPKAALAAIAKKQNVNFSYLQYIWGLKETCKRGSLEASLWVEPLRSLPKPASTDQPVPKEVSEACFGIGKALWSCVRRRMNDRGRGGPSLVIGQRPVHHRLTMKRQETREKQSVSVAYAHDRLTLVVGFLPPRAEGTTVFVGLPKLILKERDVDVFEEKNGRKIKTGSKKGAVREVLLRKEGLIALPDGAQWKEHSFSKEKTEPALVVTESCALVFDIGEWTKALNPDGGTLDAFVSVDRKDTGGLVQLRRPADGDPTTARWPDGHGAGATWLVTKNREAAFRAEWAVLFDRWAPPHPLTIAPFDSSRKMFGLPDEVQFFRDDARMKQQLLDIAGRRRMDNLWAHLNLLCGRPQQRLNIFVGKYRLGGLDEAAQLAALEKIQSNPDPVEHKLQERMNHFYGAIPIELRARFRYYLDQLDQHETLWRKRTLEAATHFAERAWRRPLDETERTRLAALCDSLREDDQSDYEIVLRTLLMRVLVSPNFLFRCEQIAANGKEAPLSAWELATRLSLFIWASMPDDELRRCAAEGSLLKNEVLAQQTKRMLADPKARGMAEHFFGQWLGFSGFSRNKMTGPDLEAFPTFTSEVRLSLHQESVTFFEDLVRNDRDLRLIVNADYSFVNSTLLNYYGGSRNPVKPVKPVVASKPSRPIVPPPPKPVIEHEPDFERISMSAYGRGGVLGMGSILVKNSRSRRTSPVNRGVWVVENLLGRHLPPPPGNVPPIPDEKDEKGLSLRNKMVKHRENPACAGCHARIDPFGFAFEAFDAAGRLRTPQQRKAIQYETTRDGISLNGLAALRDYLGDHSEETQRNLIRRMLGYALNRPVAVSDFPLIVDTLERLPEQDYRISEVVEQIVLSRQFRFHRAAKELEFSATGH